MRFSQRFIITVYILFILGLFLGYVAFLYTQFSLGRSLSIVIPDWLAYLFQVLLFLGFLYQGAERLYHGKCLLLRGEREAAVPTSRKVYAGLSFLVALLMLFFATYMILCVVFRMPIK